MHEQITVYLETTAVIDASFKSFPEILSIISSADKSITSQYVKMEIKKGFLKNLVLVHNKIVQCQTWAEVQQFLENLAASQQRYYMSALLASLTRFWSEIQDLCPDDLKKLHGNIPLKVILPKKSRGLLRLWISNALKEVDSIAQEVINPMDCYLDLEGAKRDGELFDNPRPKCPQSDKECHIKKFFADNRDDFQKIHDHLETLPDKDKDEETVKRIAAIKRILKKKLPTKHRSGVDFSNKSPFPDDAQLCWDCSDAIHAVMAPKGALVVNRNGRHFDPICKSIGKESKVYTSPTVGKS